MQVGIVGLGRMGANIARRLMRNGHQCVVFDANLDASLALGREGATSSAALQDLVKRLNPPRVVWLRRAAAVAALAAVASLIALVDGGREVVRFPSESAPRNAPAAPSRDTPELGAARPSGPTGDRRAARRGVGVAGASPALGC